MWKPINTAPKDDDTGLPPMILIGHLKGDQVIWATAVRWNRVDYGYFQCASRSGWATDYAPPTAIQHNKPRPSGEWICPEPGLEPTHWMELTQDGSDG